MRAHARVLALALLLVASQAALAQGSSVLGSDTVLATITQAMKPAFSKLSVQAVSWLAALATLQYIITNHKLLLGDADLQAAFGKLVGHVAWVGICLYVIDKGPDFISAVGDQMFGIVTDMPSPGLIMANTFGLAAVVGTLAVGVGAIPLVGGTAGNIVVIVMLLVLAVGMYFALKIFMLQLELGLIVMMSPLSFALLGLNALRDQGIAPFKSLLALAYRIVLVGVILTAFSSISDALTSTLKDISVQQIVTDGLGSVIAVIVQAIGAYVLLAFLLFKSDSIASSLAAGTASIGASDVTAAAAAGAAAGALAATGGASAVSAAGKAPQSMSGFMDKLMGSSSISNASAMGSGGDPPVFHAPEPALSSVGAPTEGSASGSAPQPPSRTQTGATSSSSKANVASGRYGADPGEIGQKQSAGSGEAQASESADGAAIGGQPAQPGSTKLEEKLEKLVDHLSQPNKPSAGQQMRELDQRLAHDKATTGVSINAHHD